LIIKEQKELCFINDFNAIVDYADLSDVIVWHSRLPVAKTKHIFMHGEYPTISVYGENNTYT